MFAQVDAAHAAGAEAFEHLVLADGEALPLALQDLLGLEIGEDAVADEQVGHLARFRRQTAGARVRLPRGMTAQIGFLHQRDSSELYRTAMDVALTYSLRLH